MKLERTLWILIASLLISPVHAQEDSAARALAKAQYMLRQVSAEKTELEARLASTEQELAKLKSEMEDRLAAAATKEEKLEGNLAAWKDRQTETQDSLQETQVQLRQARQEGAMLSEQLAKQTHNYELCYKHNAQLVDVNTALLEAYEGKSAWDALKQGEPVTGLKQVEIENLVQDYQFQIEDLDLERNQHLLETVDTAAKQ